MRPLPLMMPVLLAAVAAPVRSAPADPNDATPVAVTVVGTGEIRVMVADGASRPCDASTNQMLFNGHVEAGGEVTVTSITGSVCVDHTYGEMRESQWAGASIWSGTAWPGAKAPAIRGKISTDEP
jgi:hypothetical protein